MPKIPKIPKAKKPSVSKSKTNNQAVEASALPKVKGIVRVRAVKGTNALVQNKVYELHPNHAAKMINRGVAELV